MGLGNNCTKHSVSPHKQIPEKTRVLLEKIEQLPDAPMGRVMAAGKCPFCIYDLGYNKGLEDVEK